MSKPNKLLKHATLSSVWANTAHAMPAASQLRASKQVDVVVVGAGYMGVTAALALAEGGAKVAVLEKGILGAGASGLNGGQVIPGLKHGPSDLLAIFGAEQGEAVIRFAMEGADSVFHLIEQYRIDCDPHRNGWIQPAVRVSDMLALDVKVVDSNRWGGDAALLNADQIASLLGSCKEAYSGGWLNKKAGSLHPLNYLYGLIRAAQAAGADFYTETAANKINQQAHHWEIQLANGAVITADKVLVCTNAYADNLWPGLRQSIVAASSLQIATEPLPPDLLTEILPQRHVVSDSRRVMNYFRIGPHGRFIFGGRGPFKDTMRIDDYGNLIQAMHRFFPQLKNIAIEFCWSGKVALTRDFLPHIHQPQPSLLFALGCNGRGIGLMSALGTALGKQLLTEKVAHPFGVRPLKKLPLHRLHKIYAGALIKHYRLLDRWF